MKLLKMLPFLSTALVGLAWFGAPAHAYALQDDEAEAEDEEAEDEDESDAWYAIVGGDVYTGTGAVLRGATVLSKNGKIKEIGHDLFLPEGTEKLDARGMRVYPGLVALSASSRLTKGLFQAEPEPDFDPHLGVDNLHPDGRANAHLDTGNEEYDEVADIPTDADVLVEGQLLRQEIADSFDPFSQYLVLALSTGITTAEQSDTPVKLKRDEIKDVDMGPKNVYSLNFSLSNPNSRRQTREKLEKASDYLRRMKAWEAEGDKDKKEPSKKGVDMNYVRVLRGEVFAAFNANDREELLDIAHLAQRYRFRPVINGCMEGWTVASELGRAGAYAIVTPRTRSPKSEELVRPGGSSIENAAILHSHGVQVAVIPGNTSFELNGMTGRDLLHLPVEAGFAIRGGLDERAALDSITTIPARILGVDHRVGTLEAGKDMDAIITDGDLLHYQTFVQYTVVDGKLVYDKEEEIFFAHIRPRPELPALDPGEEPGEAEAVVDEEAPADEDAEEEAPPESEDDDEGEGADDQGAGEDDDGRL